jgi:hypothetical protein
MVACRALARAIANALFHTDRHKQDNIGVVLLADKYFGDFPFRATYDLTSHQN